jgi:hypothetical protein
MSTEVTKTWFVDGKMAEQAIPEAEIYADIHSCSYSCHRPQCIEAQRKELVAYAHDIYQAVTALEPKHNMTMRQVMEYAVTKLKEQV